MATEVSICNLALARLGDSATVTSLDPPEGSVQAQLCATFYPIARDAMLELHMWGFATKRATLAELDLADMPSMWSYAYAMPSNVIKIIALQDQHAIDDYMHPPVEYTSEVSSTGAQILFTNQQNAVIRYVGLVTDPTTFPPLFITALSFHLAAMLAGPIIKGDAGMSASKAMMQYFSMTFANATVSDTNQRQIKVKHEVTWIAGR